MPKIRGLDSISQRKVDEVLRASSTTESETVFASTFPGENDESCLSHAQAFLTLTLTEILSMIKTKNSRITEKNVLDARFYVACSLIDNKEIGHGEEVNNIRTRVRENFPEFKKQHNVSCVQIPGTVTALDLCLHSSLTFENGRAIRALSTGSKKLDALLSPPIDLAQGGPSTNQIVNPFQRAPTSSFIGVSFGIITEVVGPPGSGRTQISLTLAADAAVHNFPVYYLTSGNSAVLPLAKRLHVVCQDRADKTSNVPINDLSSVLDNVQFIAVPDAHHLLVILDKIEPRIKQAFLSRGKKSVIVIDSASGCLFSNFLSTNEGNSGMGLINEVVLTLRRLARTYFPIVFVTNSMVKNNISSHLENDTLLQRVPAMYGVWKAADVRTVLSFIDEESQIDDVKKATEAVKPINAVLEKHYAKSCKSLNQLSENINFGIASCGIIDL